MPDRVYAKLHPDFLIQHNDEGDYVSNWYARNAMG